MRIKKRLIIAGAMLILALPAVPALAEGGISGSSGSTSGETHKSSTESTTSTTETHKSTESTQSKAQELNTKLDSNHLKNCKEREGDINSRLQRIAKRSQNQLDLFATIATRTETFYTDHKLSLSNYDTLVGAVNTQKAAAQAAVNQVKSDSVGFKCDGTDPKGALSTFKTDLKSETTALKNYRTAVKNLITGVRSAREASNANG
ncbi:MAG: hypothetical protein JWO96_765 [Candidatus Saccharibacteria bacterium]|nr:hypothetical protein [Candidatus Saccharibacteria bacterium]